MHGQLRRIRWPARFGRKCDTAPVSIPPKKLPIDLTTVDTSNGAWLIAIESVEETRADGNLLVKITLEQSIGEERFRTRELGMLLRRSEAVDPRHSAELISRIRLWIDSTEGNGYLDLTA